jgi:hypothetical protein
MAKKAKASAQRVAPLSEIQEKLIAEEIAATLTSDADRRDECLARIHSSFEGAKSVQASYATLPAGRQKQKASALSRALKKARSLSQEIEPHFSAMFEEFGVKDGAVVKLGFDPKTPGVFQRYANYRRLLDHAIAVADQMRATIIVPPGQKPRDAGKFLAKTIATDLVAEFSPLAGARGRGEIVNRVASLWYEILTGRKEVDISEPPDAYKPRTIRTKFASRPTAK